MEEQKKKNIILLYYLMNIMLNEQFKKIYFVKISIHFSRRYFYYEVLPITHII